MLIVRAARNEDRDAIWSILEPVLRAGETYTLPSDISREDALAYWFADDHEPFVAEQDELIQGTYFIRANQGGGGRHVANCAYMTSAAAQGKGVARAMLEHSLAHAKSRGFRAMQFNFVVSTNERAVARQKPRLLAGVSKGPRPLSTRKLATWRAYGFDVVGRLPGAFKHPRLGYVDALVMYRQL